jgi:hypothetical protein
VDKMGSVQQIYVLVAMLTDPRINAPSKYIMWFIFNLQRRKINSIETILFNIQY